MIDVVIVGAGFAGLHALAACDEGSLGAGDRGGRRRRRHVVLEPLPGRALRRRERRVLVLVLRGLEQEWKWTERYAAQPEILRYLNHVADRFDLRRDIQLDTRVDRAPTFDEAAPGGRSRPTRRRSTAQLSASWRPAACRRAQSPDFPGIDTFAGAVYHTGRWPHEGVDFTGQRVGVIGTGSSGDPVDPGDRRAGRAPHRVPAHAELQRPGAQRARWTRRRARHARPTIAERRAGARETCATASSASPRTTSALEVGDEEREREFEARWERGGLGFLERVHRPADRPRGERARRRLRARARSARSCEDPEVAEAARADDYPLGTKRLVRRHRLLRDVQPAPTSRSSTSAATPIEEITPTRRAYGAPASTSSTRSSSPPASTR